MKIKRYKGKAFRTGNYVEGFYYQQPNYTEYPIGETKTKIAIEHYIVMAVPGDWGLPYSAQPILVEPSTIEELDEVEVK